MEVRRREEVEVGMDVEDMTVVATVVMLPLLEAVIAEDTEADPEATRPIEAIHSDLS